MVTQTAQIERALFIERQRTLLENLQVNVDRVEREVELKVIDTDIRRVPELNLPRVSLAVFNPPYFRPAEGRTGPPGERQDARFQNHGTLAELVHATDALLERDGVLCLTYPSRRLDDALGALDDAGLKLKRLRFVHPTVDRDSNLVVIRASRRRRSETLVEAPLYVYASLNVYSREAERIIEGKWSLTSS